MTKIKALLLSAGYGTRLRPLTNHWPKCLMPIGKRALLEYWLETLWQSGIQDTLVNVHYLPSIVKTFLARPRFNSWVNCVTEIKLQGTAGTLQTNTDYLDGCTVLLVHADNWCQCEFSEFIRYHFFDRPEGTLITMMTFDTDAPKTCGIVETDSKGVVQAFHEKSNNPPGGRANGAVYLIEPEVLKWLKQNPKTNDFSNQVLKKYIGKIATWHNTGLHRDIGTLKQLRQAQFDLKPDPYWAVTDAWQQWFIDQPIHSMIRE